MLDTQNWTYCQYQSGPFSVSIAVGGVPESAEGVKITYFLNKSNEKQLIYQEEYSSLEQAISKANNTYASWDFVDLEKKLQSGGCSTCQAHD